MAVLFLYFASEAMRGGGVPEEEVSELSVASKDFYIFKIKE